MMSKVSRSRSEAKLQDGERAGRAGNEERVCGWCNEMEQEQGSGTCKGLRWSNEALQAQAES